MKSVKKIPDDNSKLLPQITNVRHYNMAVSYFDLNEFQKADSLFDKLANLPTRKSEYYDAGIHYYRGLLADLRFDRTEAEVRLSEIKNEKKTKYWYWRSRMALNYPADSLTYRYFVANNQLGSRQFVKSLRETQAIKAELDSGYVHNNPDFKYMVQDLIGRNYFYTRNYDQARTCYEAIAAHFNKIEDKFARSWIRIHYGRCLRALEDFDEAEKQFDKAKDIDDDFTKIIVKRETFINKKRKKQRENRQEQG